ncbi:type II toxin-antitoxin system RelE/ParE family toxin [Zoogloea dura]|uniref:Type II toxin-antitoxin system RelE/ParE family toxin n=1 Tax=Zoogloea dura TaxID=2728840 RepID=A0A848GBJ1_9RHOO|nr:type II toxin-antitoxin system RelE/ParE family toxin [Zoogloea dura]NML26881.1 type II toxin-antitoxin system RelE/ParE family toxin [Zoogloea dura]
MPTEQHAVKLTRNFERNLDDIERFLDKTEATSAFDLLLDELADAVIPNLESFPKMGRPFLDRPALSVEAMSRVEKLRTQLNGLGSSSDIREYVLSHYLVLYTITEATIYLLSIRHHRQLSFDFGDFW